MKLGILSALLFVSFSAFSRTPARIHTLYIIDAQDIIDVQSMIDENDDVYTLYGYDKFCYEGSADAVVNKMWDWSKNSDSFFSGGGGGFVLNELEVLRGIVTYDIRMQLEDEVVPGEFRTVIIKPCE